MTRRPGPTPDTTRAPGGKARVRLTVRLGPTARDAVQRRADDEANGNASELARRLTKWALYGPHPMPTNYR